MGTQSVYTHMLTLGERHAASPHLPVTVTDCLEGLRGWDGVQFSWRKLRTPADPAALQHMIDLYPWYRVPRSEPDVLAVSRAAGAACTRVLAALGSCLPFPPVEPDAGWVTPWGTDNAVMFSFLEGATSSLAGNATGTGWV